MEWIICGAIFLTNMGIIIVTTLLWGLKHHRVKIIPGYKVRGK